MTQTFLLIASVYLAASTLGTEDRINLVDFARVVEFTGNSPETLEIHELDRGPDGYGVSREDDDGTYMIGVEWDEPRDVAEVNIEFRHAIANRQQIRVQYWQHHWPGNARGGWAPLDDPFHGKWVTAKADWWAGDRDVSFAFVPYNQEQPGDDAPDVVYRRTRRVRILCGKYDLPPVRYLRAYGPHEPAHATFDIRFDENSPFVPPVAVSVVNGYVIGGDGQTTMPAARLSDQPASVNVRYADGDLDTPTRTIVTVRNARDDLQGFSFLPAEAVKFGIIRIPSLGIVVTHRGSDKDLQAGLTPGMSVYDRVAREPEQTFDRARREIPELQKTKQQGRPLYLPLGPPDARQEIAVSYDGNILIEKSALKVKGDDSQRLHWPGRSRVVSIHTGEPAFDRTAEGTVKQRLLDGYLPIVINNWQQDGLEYEQTCVAGFLDEHHGEIRGDETVVLLTRIEIANPTADTQTACVALRSSDDEALVLDGGHVTARGRGILNDESYPDVEPYETNHYRFHLMTDGSGELKVESYADGPIDAGAFWRTSIPAGRFRTLVVAVPYVTLDTDAEREQIASLQFDQVLQHEADRWRRVIDRAAVFNVPDPLLNDFYKAQLAHILITADRDPYNGTRVLPAATYGYNVCVNESCHQIRALEIRGLHDEAQAFLDAVVAGQSSRGLHGRFTDPTGVLHGLPTKHGDYQSFNYNLDHGFALWMLNEHYRFTRDRAWLESVADAMVAACDFVTRQRTTEPEANSLARDDQRWGVGLLPPGHLEDPPEWLWWFAVNAYAYRGMAATAESLAQIGHPQAARIAGDADAFGQVLRDACTESMIRAPVVRLRDGTYVPHQPTRSRLRSRDLGWIRDALYGPVHLIDCGIYPDDSPEAEWILRDTEDNVFIGDARGRKLDDYDTQWFSWGGITLQSNLLPNPLVYLRRGQPEHAVRAFYNSLAANVYADVRTFTEHPIQAYGIGTGPFFKSPDESAFIVWLRHLLILEKGDELDLLAGVPRGWLEPGREIVVEGAPTWFGPADLHVRSDGPNRKVRVEVKGPDRNPPERVRLHLRTAQPLTAVRMNGRSLSPDDFAKGIVTLPAGSRQATIEASY